MNPIITDKFLPLIENKQTRYFVSTGGRGSGKSYSIALILTLSMLTGHTNILFTRYTLKSAEISIIPEFKQKIEILGKQKHFRIKANEIECTKTGSKIFFRGIKTSEGTQTANLKSIADIDTWVLDEAEELVDIDIFHKIDESIRVVNRQNKIILILNPTTQEHWIYSHFFETGKRNDTCYIHSTYLDNEEYLSQSFLDKANELKQSNPEKYSHRFLGQWMDRKDGVIFDNWIEEPFNENLQYIFGADFGFSIDPSTLIKTAIDKKNKRIYVKEYLYQAGLGTDQIYSIFKTHAGNTLIVADCAEDRLISDLRNKGLNIIPCEKGPGSISAGINSLLDYTIVVDPYSHNLKKELRNYVWLNKGSRLACDDYNHLIDPLRYCERYLNNPSFVKILNL